MEDHDLRYALANELHARPFPSLKAPCRALFLAIKHPQNAAARDRDLDRAHLMDLLDRHGVPHPQPDATHYFGPLGKHMLKWESHTEFVSYTLFSDGVADQPFAGHAFQLFPADWLAKVPGVRVTSALIRVELFQSDADVAKKVVDWFVPESVACSSVVDDAAIVASDFRIDANGHIRMAVFARPETGPNRIGRIVQRLSEIETYKTMSMLGLSMARELTGQMNNTENDLSDLIDDMSSESKPSEATLKSLLKISAGLENMQAKSSFRFGATGAYAALVTQRIEAMRETHVHGRQTLREFMLRRFDPAMRTVGSSEERLARMTDRATRAGELLRTRVDVERSAQNQKLLASMDARADMQLRLQQTVEGLSVVAISYYAINLALYLMGPVGYALDLSKTAMAALVTPPVVIAVWYMVERIRKKMH
ncbi:MAG: DUF3422 domain-containing protein [Rhodobacteraceae bacterium]|nr:DUF3422 domain-containing protein [Paracoccaceae bacterium]